MKSDRDIEVFILRCQSWVTRQRCIKALALVGSYARGDAHAGSDIDLMIICEDPDEYLLTLNWLLDFGAVQNVQREDWGLVQTWRVKYAEMEIEFNITTKQWCSSGELKSGTGRVVNDGMRILFDPENLLHSLAKSVVEAKSTFHLNTQLATNWQTSGGLQLSDSSAEEIPALQAVYDSCAYIGKWCGEPGDSSHAMRKSLDGEYLPPHGSKSFQRLQSIRRADGALCGYLEIYHGFPDSHTFWIATLAVARAFQGKGIGRNVVTGLGAQVSSLEIYEQIGLGVGVKNWPALRFWLANGFDRVLAFKGDSECSETTFANLWLCKKLS